MCSSAGRSDGGGGRTRATRLCRNPDFLAKRRVEKSREESRRVAKSRGPMYCIPREINLPARAADSPMKTGSNHDRGWSSTVFRATRGHLKSLCCYVAEKTGREEAKPFERSVKRGSVGESWCV